MGLEAPVNYIPELNANNPLGIDPKSQGDDHIRNIKLAIGQSFGAFVGTTADPKSVTLTEDQINDAALKGAANVFTKAQEIASINPRLWISETDAAAEAKNWLVEATGGTLRAYAADDVRGSFGEWLRITRTGINIDSLLFETAVGESSILCNGNGEVTLYNNNIKRLQTAQAGQVYVHRDGNTDVENNAVVYAYADGTIRGFTGFLGNQTLAHQSFVHGALVSLVGEDAGGVQRTMLGGDPDAGVGMYFAGQLTAITSSNGVTIQDPNASAPNILFVNSTFGRVGFVQMGPAGLILRSESHGANLQFQGEDAGGVNRNILTGDPDGLASLFDTGIEVLRTRVDGFSVASNGNPTLGFINLAGTVQAGIFHSGASENLVVQNNRHGGGFVAQGEDLGGVLRNLVFGDPDADAKLYFKGAEAFRTANEADLGKSTSAELRHRDGSLYAVGLAPMPPVNITGALTIGAEHSQKCVRWTGGAAGLDVTLPDDSDIPVNEWGMIANKSASDKDVVEGAGVTIYRYDGVGTTGDVTLAPGERLFWWKISDTLYEVW